MSARNSAASAADRVLVITRIFDAPPRLVFKAWSSCEHLTHWMGPEGFRITSCEMDFRVGGKIFATLGYPDKSRGMVKLSPEQQHYFSKDYPDVFVPVKGAWGRRGATSVHLKTADKETLEKAIEAAWRNTAPKHIAEQFPGKV